MNKKEEAREIICSKLNELRSRSYRDPCATYLNQPKALGVKGQFGTGYQLEVEAFWDDKPDQNLRVMVSVGCGGMSDFVPMTDSFIVSSNGSVLA